jgi:type I restriction enzyme R subunit
MWTCGTPAERLALLPAAQEHILQQENGKDRCIRAVAPEGVVDIFTAAGLQKLLKGEIATRRRKNVVQARSFADMLEQTIRRYQNPAVEAAQVIEELVETVRRNVTIDWTLRENVRAQLRVLVKRILRKYGYPPDKQEKATQTVLEQAALLSGEWATA